MPQISRRTFLTSHLVTWTAALGGCGGGGGAVSASEIETPQGAGQSPLPPPGTPVDPVAPAEPPVPPARPPEPPVAPAPSPEPPLSPAPSPKPPVEPPPPAPVPALLSVTLRSGSVAGRLPYTATVLPLRGEVPEGFTVASWEDPNLRASVLSTHDDGSAAVIVVAGETSVAEGGTKAISLGLVASTDETPLTLSRISALVSSVTVDFTSTYGGTAGIVDFAANARIWWANSRVICASYRLPAPLPGSTALEAVVYITAFAQSDRAHVEVVIENGRLDARNSTVSSKPADANYSGLTVAINGARITPVGGVNSSAAPTGVHQPFRAWYCRGWIGGDPEIRATQAHIELQRHPLLWRCDQPNTADLSVYASDMYVPWSTGRHRASGMGGTGGHDSIGPLPLWEARALQSGDHRAWNATEASALAILSYNINYRDSVTGRVPDHSMMSGKRQQGSDANWPITADALSRATFEGAHQPAAGLMAFVGRPTPVFIELAQKVAVWSGTNASSTAYLDLLAPYKIGLDDMTGVYGFGQSRGYAWSLRQCVHATFLSPDSSSWRAGGKVWMGRFARVGSAFQKSNKATLNYMWSTGPYAFDDHGNSGKEGYQSAQWMNNFIVGELHKAASVRLCAAEDQAILEGVADWIATGAVRWVNEQPDGGWRFCADEVTYLRRDKTTFASYAEMRAYHMTGTGPSTVNGKWFGYDAATVTDWAVAETKRFDDVAGTQYPSIYWYALVAAVERGVHGAAAAWATVTGGITNLSTWRLGFGAQPRWGAYPRTR